MNERVIMYCGTWPSYKCVIEAAVVFVGVWYPELCVMYENEM